MPRQRFVTVVLMICPIALSAAPAGSAGAESATQPLGPRSPNILFILSDQYRHDCLGVAGNAVAHTPNLDRLAREGMRFTHCYAAQPVCSPNRAAILTGLYPHSAGVQDNCVGDGDSTLKLPKSSRTMGEMLALAGYDCGYFGKWHLGRRDAFETFPEYPRDGRGDDHYFGKGNSRRYGVDVITDDAIAFLKKTRTRPFYLYVSYYPPHPPYSVPEAYHERYKGVEPREKRIYLAMCTKIDEAVGTLLKSLADLGLAGNTLVVFTSDHGHNFTLRWNHHLKRLCYDTSARVPLLMRLPGTIPAGRVTEGLISSVDLTPTILSLIGRPVPPGLQGQDLSALVRGRADKGRACVFIENVPFPFAPQKGEERCVFDGRWKLILSTQRPPELYDPQADPEESNNRWAEKAASPVVARLLEQLDRWARDTKDPLAPRLLQQVR